MSVSGLLDKRMSFEAFDKVVKRNEDFKRNTKLIIQFFDDFSRIFSCFGEDQRKLTLVLQKQIGARPVLQKSLIPKCAMFMQVITKNMFFLSESDRTISQQLHLQIQPRFETINSELLNPVIQSLRRYKQCEIKLDDELKKHCKACKSLQDGLGYYKATFDDPLYTFNVPQQSKRYLQCKEHYNQAIALQKTVVKLMDQNNMFKDRFQKQLGQMRTNLQDHLFQINEQVSSLIKKKIVKFCQIFGQIKSEFQTCLKVVEQSNGEQLELTQFKGEIFFSDIGKKDIETFQDSQLISFLKFIGKQVYQIKIYEGKRLTSAKEILSVVDQALKSIDRLSKSINRQISSFQKLIKKISQIYGKKVVSFLECYLSMIRSCLKILQKLVKKISVKINVIQQFFVNQNKLQQILQKQFRNMIEDHSLVRKQFIRKKGLPADFQLNQKQPNKYANFCGDISRLMKDSISQKIIMISFHLQQHEKRVIKNSFALKAGLLEIYKQIADNFGLVKQTSDATLQQYLNSINNQSSSKYEQSRQAFLKDQTLSFLGERQQDKVSIKVEFNEEPKKQFEEVKKPEQENQQTRQELQESKEIKLQKQGPLNQQRILQTYKKSIELESQAEFLQQKFKFEKGEKHLYSCSCAFSQKILLQGRLYITSKRIYFYSNFNSSNLFFGKTELNILKKDLIGIQKKNLFIINNTITLNTKKGNVTFTTLFHRDQTLDIIKKVFQLHDQPQAPNEQRKEPQLQKVQQVQQNQEQLPNILQAPQQQLLLHQQQVQAIFSKQKQTSQLIRSHNFEGFSLKQVFNELHQRQNIEFQKKTINFQTKMRLLAKDYDITVGPWPNTQQFLKHFPLKRVLRFKHPITGAPIPFSPKFISVEDNQQLYLISNNKFGVISRVQSSGAPYTDTFQVKMINQFQEVQGSVRINIMFELLILKKVFATSIISKKSREQALAGSQITVKTMQDHLNLAKISKQKRKISLQKNKSKSNQQANQLQEVQLKLKDLQQKLQISQEQVRDYKSKLESSGKKVNWLISLLVLTLAILILK